MKVVLKSISKLKWMWMTLAIHLACSKLSCASTNGILPVMQMYITEFIIYIDEWHVIRLLTFPYHTSYLSVVDTHGIGSSISLIIVQYGSQCKLSFC